MTDYDYPQDQVDGEAAEWVARMGAGPLNGFERGALDIWLGRSPVHRAALNEAQAAWNMMTRMDLEASDLGLAPFHPVTARPMLVWARAAALAASLLVAVWTGMGAFVGDPLALAAADHRTGRGQVEKVTLPDGSVVQIGPSSAIALHFSETERAVELLSGQAYFTVAPMTESERRPFVVAAANGRSRALGTQFMVARNADGVEITVAEHTVEVSAVTGREDDGRVVLSPGRSVRYGAAGLEPPAEVDVATAVAWQRGLLVFDRVPLSRVVEELNRYRYSRIIVSDRELASRQVSGVFSVGNSDAALDTVVQVLGVRSASLPFITMLY